jgi:hypothetical protein
MTKQEEVKIEEYVRGACGQAQHPNVCRARILSKNRQCIKKCSAEAARKIATELLMKGE